MRYARQFHYDDAKNSGVECDENGWSKADYFTYPTDLYIETMDLWNCEDFSMDLQVWCENASVGDVFEDDDIRVTACE